MTTEQMEQKIKQSFPHCNVAVIDLTGGQDHFEVRISEKSLQGLSRIKQHQAVMAIFNEELKTGEVHALAIKTLNI